MRFIHNKLRLFSENTHLNLANILVAPCVRTLAYYLKYKEIYIYIRVFNIKTVDSV